MFLADFGLGHIMSATRVIGTATMNAGTPGFQSPEQLKGESIGISSDVFALGGLLTEFFGGKPLWGDMASHAIMFKVDVEGVMSDVRHLPAPIRSISKLCLCPLHSRKSAAAILCMLCD